ncbi:MAG: DUF6319 family protein [Sciscionella sp.]
MSVDPNPLQDNADSQADSKAAKAVAGKQPRPSAADAAPAGTDAEAPESPQESTEQAPRKRGRPRKQSTARKTRSVELVLTVTGTVDGEWQADLKHGSEHVVQGLQISAAAVSRAAKELHDDISNGIETVLGAAREQHRSRLEELEAEMQKVKQALAELEE